MNADRRRSMPIGGCTLDNWVCVRREAAAREAGLWEHFLALPHSVFDRAALYFKKRPFAGIRSDWSKCRPAPVAPIPATTSLTLNPPWSCIPILLLRDFEDPTIRSHPKR